MKWVLQRGDRNFELPAIIYRNKGFYQKQFMSVLELDEIISLLEDQHQSLALVLAYTGLDLGDAVGLSWRDIDLQEQMIRTQRGKTGIKVDVPFTKAVSDVLRVRARVRKLHDDRVFHTITGQGFQKAWKRALKKSSIEWNVRVKDLRHFFASFMLNNEVDHLTVVTLMGHTSVEKYLEEMDHANQTVETGLESVCDSVSRKGFGRMTDPEELTQGNVFIPFSTTPNWVRGGSEGNKNSKTKNAVYTLILIDLQSGIKNLSWEINRKIHT